MAGQEGILLGGRNEAELVGAEDFHGSNSSTNRGTPYISGLKPGVLRRFSDKYVNDLFCSMFLDFRFVLETPLDVSRKREK